MLAHFSHHLLTALPTPLLPFIRDEFALDYTQTGLVVSAFTIAYGVSQLPSGWLSDRIGPRIVISFGISGVAVFGFLIGITQTYSLLVALILLMGVVGGGYHPTAPTLISASVEPKKLGRALGLHAVGGSASYFLVPIIAAVMASTWGWRSSFIGLAIPTLAFGILFYMLLAKVPAVRKIERVSSSDVPVSPREHNARRLTPFIVLSAFTVAVTSSVGSFVPLFMVDHFGVSKDAAAGFFALLYVAGFWGGPLGGLLSDRLSATKLIIAIAFVSAPAVYLLNLAPYGLGLGALLVAIGMLNYIRMPVSESYIVSQAPQSRRATILGVYYFGTMEGAGLLTPVVGRFIDQFGFHTAFTMTAAMLVLAAIICSIFMRESRSKKPT